ncbi:DEAD/DEAH box helicase family protein [Staphylococcus sp. HKU1]|uniref:DEAD/DEAH box helicase family protein n=1 Tax=unclassified Staphylococcus TaxID=91994 RepID=UPI002041A7F5|nr:DEAD/DEAH box helicase family protein [Staphylococcus sp. Marseille-Q6910]
MEESIIKNYGKLISDISTLTDEIIHTRSKGVTRVDEKWFCVQCNNQNQQLFYQYYSRIQKQHIVYCRHCINLGRMDNVSDIIITKSHQQPSLAHYQLDFELTEQQQFASNHILKALKHYQPLLLYAVTGAGKTEMIFESIQYARRRGDNVAIVSPRVDVVIEVAKRVKEAFKKENIDVLYQGQSQQYDGHFIISTVHQLYRYKAHFDFIVVDEVDAFPLSMDENLMQNITSASKPQHCHVYMTATPPRSLVQQMTESHIVRLPARYHGYPLPEPRFKYFKVNYNKPQRTLTNYFNIQIHQQRFTLVFFNHIDSMLKMYKVYKTQIQHLDYVYSEDPLRFDKVAAFREGTIQILFTTTILERGFTKACLDVLVLNSHTFTSSALVQIAGRVGRKIDAPTGSVMFLHEGITLKMMKAKREIVKMNRLATQRGWVRE